MVEQFTILLDSYLKNKTSKPSFRKRMTVYDHPKVMIFGKIAYPENY